MCNPESQFHNQMQADGFSPPEIIADGKPHRFDIDKHGDKKGFYILFTDGVPCGRYGSWAEQGAGGWLKWSAKSENRMTDAERKENQRRWKKAQAERQKAIAEQHRMAAIEAQRIFDTSTPAKPEHPYLARKGVKAHSIRQQSDDLIIPVRIDGKLSSIQRIKYDGTKLFQSGGAITGGYHSIGKPDGRIYIAEGYATGATIHEATGEAVAVAFNAGNLEPVAKTIRAKFPNIEIVIAGDTDSSKVGEKKGKAAAAAVSGKLVLPHFEDDESGSDWNDWASIHGLDAVSDEIERKIVCVDPEAPETGRHADLVRMSDVKPEPISWLWPGRIAIGKINLFAGDPGLGKSLLTVEMAAHVSRSKPWPVDESECPLGDVLLLSAEDDLADTIRPRLDAAGADVSRVYSLPMVTTINNDGKESKRVPSLVDDVERIGEMLNAHPDIRLLTIDPISAYLAGVDSHKNTDMRAVLSPWADLASRYRVAIVCISHLNKGQGSAMYRTAGSIAFMAAARAAFSVSKDKDDDLRRLVLPVKNNLGPDEGGLAYRVGTDNGIPRIEWEPEAVHITAEDALSPDGEAVSERNDATAWLREILADDPLTAKTVEKLAGDAGFAWRTVQRAGQKASDIEIKRDGFGKGSKSMWTYIRATEVHTRHHINVARMGKSGVYGENEPDDLGSFDDQLPANDARVSVSI